jgi:hypothetical protein
MPIPRRFFCSLGGTALCRPVRSPGWSAPLPWAWVRFTWSPSPPAMSAEAPGPPKFLGNPLPACPALGPRRTGGPSRCGPPHVAFRSFKDVGSAASNFRGSITRPARLPVYASQPRSPWIHARLGTGCWLGLAGRENPLGPDARFQAVYVILPPRPSFAWRNERLQSNNSPLAGSGRGTII